MRKILRLEWVKIENNKCMREFEIAWKYREFHVDQYFSLKDDVKTNEMKVTLENLISNAIFTVVSIELHVSVSVRFFVSCKNYQDTG